MTLDSVGLRQYNIIMIIYCNVGLKCFISFTQMFVIIISFCLHLYFSR